MKRVAICLLVMVVLISGCSAAPARESVANSVGMGAPMVQAEKAEAPAFSESVMDASSGGQASSVDQLIIQNANLSIAVADPIATMDAIIKMTEEVKGFVVSSNSYKTTQDSGMVLPAAQVTIRVPAEQLTDIMSKIKAMVPDPSTDVLSENRTGQNVTKEYIDLKSRLKNQEDAEAQLREIMASATKTEDVMSVYNQLTATREQIEVLKGQIKYYEESAAMSAVEINIASKAGLAPISIGGWQPAGVARDAVQALLNALKFFAYAGIWIICFIIPVLLVLAIPVVAVILIIRTISRRNKAKKLAAAVPSGEEKK